MRLLRLLVIVSPMPARRMFPRLFPDLVVVLVYSFVNTFKAKFLQVQRTDQQKQAQECVTPVSRTTSSSYSPMSCSAEGKDSERSDGGASVTVMRMQFLRATANQSS